MPIQTAIDSISQNQGSPFGFKNRIINGAMVFDQRNAGASVTGNNDVYTLDRWKCLASQSSKFTVQQVTDAPSGFINSLKVTSSSAYTVGSAENFGIRQIPEGFSMQDWNWPNAGGAIGTLSFWVKCSLTGTFGGSVFSGSDNFVFSYSISSANTWEYKTVTISAPTSGTFTTANDAYASIFWSLGTGVDRQQTAGSWYYANVRRSVTGEVQVVATNAATWQITGVQLEKGSTATSFDYRPYGTELALCQRYFAKMDNDGSGGDATLGLGMQQSTTGAAINIKYPVKMRAEPTASISSLQVTNLRDFSTNATLSSISPTYDTATISVTHSASGAINLPIYLQITTSTAGFLALSAEL